MLSESAPAKINLFLHVIGRRADGYRLLESMAVFADAGERLEAVSLPGGELRLTCEGPFAAGLPPPEDNLALRAAAMLRRELGVEQGAALVLHKTLPVASGVGGGSADAAAALRLLPRLWQRDAPPAMLSAIAGALGADVPACLLSQPLWMRGAGEEVTPLLRCPALPLLLVNPRIPLATADVFAALGQPGYADALSPPGSFASPLSLLEFLKAAENSLQEAALRLCPAIGEALRLIGDQPGCRLARMSGSGATCFGIFGGGGEAELAARRIGRDRPEWWALPVMSAAAANEETHYGQTAYAAALS